MCCLTSNSIPEEITGCHGDPFASYYCCVSLADSTLLEGYADSEMVTLHLDITAEAASDHFTEYIGKWPELLRQVTAATRRAIPPAY